MFGMGAFGYRLFVDTGSYEALSDGRNGCAVFLRWVAVNPVVLCRNTGFIKAIVKATDFNGYLNFN